jgi:hypothetical protein
MQKKSGATKTTAQHRQPFMLPFPASVAFASLLGLGTNPKDDFFIQLLGTRVLPTSSVIIISANL